MFMDKEHTQTQTHSELFSHNDADYYFAGKWIKLNIVLKK